jgi:restriction system protein
MALRKYSELVTHAGLGKSQLISGTDWLVFQQRVAAKRWQWDMEWQRQQAIAARRRELRESREQQAHDRAQEKEAKRAYLQARKLEAEEANLAAEQAVNAVERLLEHTLQVDDRVDFDALKDRSTFAEPPPHPVRTLVPPPQPVRAVVVHASPTVSFWRMLLELLIPGSKRSRLAAEERVRSLQNVEIEARNTAALKVWESECATAKHQYEERVQERQKRVEDWASRKRIFEARQTAANAAVDALRDHYRRRAADAVEQYCELVLSASEYPESFPQTFYVQYRPEPRLLVVEYRLPVPEQMPRLKTVKYVQSRDELSETELSDAAQKKLYDGAIYQIVIRTLHELFEADVVDALAGVAINGIVEAVDPATGLDIRPCIVSVQASKPEFAQLKLAAIDPKACFRKLRGVGSAQLHALAPVQPLLRFARDDVRFVDGRAVLDGVQDGQNIACMDWNDFEHLIRDLFEREFSGPDAEVKLTRASRDGGVDAVIFDPDPIRGGKLVVQAKRYTNTVGVAAVRDLYGAMTSERAARGILVTTAEFGSDSWEFAKDKPITLLDGGRLLHLLQKHGVPARIDLQEAKRVMRS